MKLRTAWLIGCTVIALATTGCDGRESESTTPDWPNGPNRAETGQGLARLDGAFLRELRLRADAAFDSSRHDRSRFQSRIGPQPWPRDLPRRWPQPVRAVVVADAKGLEKGRLLLIDLPGPRKRELESYRLALLDHGFTIDRTDMPGDTGRLRVKGGDVEASLRFLSRGHDTRLEILFLTKTDRDQRPQSRRVGG